jgi:rhamnose utilization protein RhaD (predicted bifunctional aldolase and dehydrogenase)
VAHSHSVIRKSGCLREGGQGAVAQALEGADYAYGFVPYVDPGARLTFSIRDELARVERENRQSAGGFADGKPRVDRAS